MSRSIFDSEPGHPRTCGVFRAHDDFCTCGLSARLERQADAECEVRPINPFLHWLEDDRKSELGVKASWLHLLRNDAGNCAIEAARESDVRLKAANQAREKAFDEIANFLESLS